MLTFFINNICIFILYYFNRKKLLFMWMLFTVSCLLYLLPSTGDDYVHYKLDYDSAYLNSIFPYFHTYSYLTAEPLYKFYTAFIKLTLNLSFQGFLVFNYIINTLVLYFLFKKIFKEKYVMVFFLVSLLTIVPTIYYFSVRSSISLTFAILAFISFSQNKNLKGLIYSLLTVCFHSQYIPVLFFLCMSSMLYKTILTKFKNKKTLLFFLNLFLFIVVMILLKFPYYVYDLLAPVLKNFPTYKLIRYKLHYLVDARHSFRITSFLSIILYPSIFIYLYKKKHFNNMFKDNIGDSIKEKFVFLLGVIVYFSFLINFFFIQHSHIAGRLSRLSDYFFFIIGFGTFFMSIKQKHYIIPLILVALLFVAAAAYRSLYNFSLTIM